MHYSYKKLQAGVKGCKISFSLDTKPKISYISSHFSMFRIPNAKVVTEIEALKILADVEAKQVVSGGVGESAGSVVLVVKGEEAVVLEGSILDRYEETLNYVLGYACFNDVTERSLVSGDPFLLALAKGFDTFGPFGPYVVTDLDPNHLEVKTYLNGKQMQYDNTKNCVFNIQRILGFASERITLVPGDVVITGTPKGIAPMKPGDVVEVEVEGIGKLRNTVKSAQ